MRLPILLATTLITASTSAAAQRPAIPAKVAPGAAAAVQLQTVQAGPGGGPHTAVLPDIPARSSFLDAAARGTLLGQSGMSGSADAQPLRVDAAPAAARTSLRLSNPRLVANRSVWSSGRVDYTPFATFQHGAGAGWEGVTVGLEPGAAARYLADCEVGVASAFEVATAGARTVLRTAAPAGSTGHLHFLVEVPDPARGGWFELTAAENGSWSFFGCELTPVR